MPGYAGSMGPRYAIVGAAFVLGIAFAIGVGDATSASSRESSAKAKKCGHRQLYGHKLTIKVHGEPLPCPKVRRIVSGRCDPNGEPWFCFSFRAPGRPLVWIRAEERFERRPSTWIGASRYPCRSSGALAEEWRGPTQEFPTRKQIVADDLIRCELLEGKGVEEVEALLGEPLYNNLQRNGRFLGYTIGPTRDSFFQVDSEVLSLRFTRKGSFREATIYQS
jgi:hypothetical protein